MGKALSSLRTPTKKRVEPAEPTDEADDEEPRPAKRRRPNPTDDNDFASRNVDNAGFREPLGQVINRSRPLSRLYWTPGLVEPSDFYGRKSNNGKVSSILAKSPVKFKQTLRVDIVEIHSEADDVESFALSHLRKSPIEIQCKCSISIFFAKNDKDPSNISTDDFIEICRTVKPCTLRIAFGNDDEISRQFVMSEPFLFAPEQFYTNRKERKSNGQWGSTTVWFADKYNVQISIEPIGSHKDWPPVDIPSYQEINSGGSAAPMAISQLLEKDEDIRDELYLFAKTDTRHDALMDPDRQITSLKLEVRLQPKLKQNLEKYTLKLEMKWALPPNVNSSLPVRTAKIGPSRADFSGTDLPTPASNPFLESPIRRAREDTSAENSPAGDRAARQRSKVATYNLKALSAQAQGKSPRVRKTKVSNAGRGLDDEEISVAYSLHRGDAADANTTRTTIVMGLRCVFCNYSYSHVEELRLHLHSNHTRFKFSLRKSTPRFEFFVEVAKPKFRSGAPLQSEREKTFYLGKPMSLFDLEEHLTDNEPWTRRRQGNSHGTWPDRMLNRAQDSSHSSSPHNSRHSSPNTSNGTDDLMEFEAVEKEIPIRNRKAFYVPITDKPLYDKITKRVLEPGEEMQNSDEEKDAGWLYHRNRDIINDFEDVSLEEKDYINTYNPFILNENLTGTKYLPESVLRFVETHKTWFAEKSSRKREFGRFMEVLVMRGDLDQKWLSKCIDVLKAAEKAAEKANKGKEVEINDEPPPKPRSLTDCICGELAKPPNRIICRGAHCQLRFFHPKCAEEAFGRPVTGIWKCDNCLS